MKVLKSTIRNVLDQQSSNRLGCVWIKQFILHSQIWSGMKRIETAADTDKNYSMLRSFDESKIMYSFNKQKQKIQEKI